MSKMTRRTVIALSGAAPLALSTKAFGASHASMEIEIAGFKFNPAELEVPAGTVVRFVNNDGAPHTATADDGSFDTGRLNRGDFADVEIPAGTHAYICLFHPNMKATITGA